MKHTRMSALAGSNVRQEEREWIKLKILDSDGLVEILAPLSYLSHSGCVISPL